MASAPADIEQRQWWIPDAQRDLESACASGSNSSFSSNDDGYDTEREREEPEMDFEQLFEMEAEVLDTFFFPLTAAPDEALENPVSFARDIDRGVTDDAFDMWLESIGAIKILDQGPWPSPTE